MTSKEKKEQLKNEIDTFLKESDEENKKNLAEDRKELVKEFTGSLNQFLKDFRSAFDANEKRKENSEIQTRTVIAQQTKVVSEVVGEVVKGIKEVVGDAKDSRKDIRTVVVKNQVELSDIEIPDEVEVKNFPKSDAPLIVQAIKTLGEKIKAAITAFVSNKTPSEAIPVRLVDKSGKGFYDAAMNVQYGSDRGGQEQSQKLSDINGTLDPLAKYKIANKDDDDTTNYYGFVDKDGAWYILIEVISAGNDTYRYARGDSDFPTNWTGRAGLSYDYFNEVF